MANKTEEEIIVEELCRIRVRLNRKNEMIIQITCTREIIGGYSMALSYASEQDVRNVLFSFGFEQRAVDNGLKILREINFPDIEPQRVVDVGKRYIPNEILIANRFTAV
jgi:hypothetical protein